MRIPWFQTRHNWLGEIPRYLRTTFLLSLLLGLLMALLVSTLLFQLQPEVPLFYSLPRKAEHLVNKEWLFVFPGISMLITIAHTLIFTSSQHIEQLLLKLFAWTTVMMQVVLFLALLRIVLIIT